MRVISYVEREIHRLNDNHVSLDCLFTNYALDMLQFESIRFLYGFHYAIHVYLIFLSVHSILHLYIGGTYLYISVFECNIRIREEI